MDEAQLPRPIGRPSKYNPKLAEEICELIAQGCSVREICLRDDMPERQTIYRWLAKIPDFSDRYAKATKARADFWAEEIIDISDDGTNDWMTRNGKDGEETAYAVNGEAINRSRLRVDTRKWLMARLEPKKYGDRVQTEVTGANGGPLQIEEMGSLELARRLALLLMASQTTPIETITQGEPE